jgi:hypothetical protein
MVAQELRPVLSQSRPLPPLFLLSAAAVLLQSPAQFAAPAPPQPTSFCPQHRIALAHPLGQLALSLSARLGPACRSRRGGCHSRRASPPPWPGHSRASIALSFVVIAFSRHHNAHQPARVLFTAPEPSERRHATGPHHHHCRQPPLLLPRFTRARH